MTHPSSSDFDRLIGYRCSLYRCAPPKIEVSRSWSSYAMLGELLQKRYGMSTLRLRHRLLYRSRAQVSTKSGLYRPHSSVAVWLDTASSSESAQRRRKDFVKIKKISLSMISNQ